MEIHLWRDGASALRKPDDFRAFKVVAHGFTTAAELQDRLAGLGRADKDGEHVFIEAPWLAGHASNAPDPEDWRRRLEEMAALAARHGWVDAAGRIRAHVEWADD
jgi:hypothetical protein